MLRIQNSHSFLFSHKRSLKHVLSFILYLSVHHLILLKCCLFQLVPVTFIFVNTSSFFFFVHRLTKLGENLQLPKKELNNNTTLQKFEIEKGKPDGKYYIQQQKNNVQDILRCGIILLPLRPRTQDARDVMYLTLLFARTWFEYLSFFFEMKVPFESSFKGVFLGIFKLEPQQALYVQLSQAFSQQVCLTKTLFFMAIFNFKLSLDHEINREKDVDNFLPWYSKL